MIGNPDRKACRYRSVVEIAELIGRCQGIAVEFRIRVGICAQKTACRGRRLQGHRLAQLNDMGNPEQEIPVAVVIDLLADRQRG